VWFAKVALWEMRDGAALVGIAERRRVTDRGICRDTSAARTAPGERAELACRNQMTQSGLHGIYPWKWHVKLGESTDWLRTATGYWCHEDFAPGIGRHTREPGESQGTGGPARGFRQAGGCASICQREDLCLERYETVSSMSSIVP
jgi:hypothetical protein